MIQTPNPTDAAPVPFEREVPLAEQIQDQAGNLLDTVSAWPSIDLVGLGLGLCFLVMGLRHGFSWQLSRLGAVTLAFVAAIVFGPEVGRVVGPTVVPGDPERAAPLLGSALVFLSGLLLAGMVFALLRRRHRHEDEEEPMDVGPGFGSRLVGGALGLLTGAAVGIGLLLLLHVSASVLDLGNSWVEAAGPSRSRDFGARAVETLQDQLPADYAEGAKVWSAELAPPPVTTPPGGSPAGPPATGR